MLSKFSFSSVITSVCHHRGGPGYVFFLRILSHQPNVHPTTPVNSLQWQGLVSAKVRSINIHESQAGNKDKGQPGSRAVRAMNRNRPECKTACFWCLLMCPVAILRRHHAAHQASCVFTCVCYVHIDKLRPSFFFFLAVWWRVQRAAGGPGRGSEEGGENQRAGGEDPSPGVPGKSIRRNAIKWLCKIVLLCYQGLSKYRFYSKRKHEKRELYKIIHIKKTPNLFIVRYI